MATRVQGHPESAHRILYHHGLIKLLVTFTLEELQIPWDYFLKEQEQVPDSQNEGDASEEVRVFPEPGISMKPVKHAMIKWKGPKTRNMPSKEKKSRNPHGGVPSHAIEVFYENGEGKQKWKIF
jgi:hypothetical protein